MILIGRSSGEESDKSIIQLSDLSISHLPRLLDIGTILSCISWLLLWRFRHVPYNLKQLIRKEVVAELPHFWCKFTLTFLLNQHGANQNSHVIKLEHVYLLLLQKKLNNLI